MAEQEVAKHTKKVYTIMKDKEHSFWYKLKEFLLEIFIIVFAITVSLWLHNWSEHRKEQSEVKTFLLGLKKDLQADIIEMKSDQQSYNIQQNAYQYLYNIKFGKSAS